MYYIITMLKLKIQVKLQLKYKQLIIRQLFVKKANHILLKDFNLKCIDLEKKLNFNNFKKNRMLKIKKLINLYLI